MPCIQGEHLQGKGLLSLFMRLAFASSFLSFLLTYLIFALFAAKGVPDAETLQGACD